jgi:hypothetical protein
VIARLISSGAMAALLIAACSPPRENLEKQNDKMDAGATPPAPGNPDVSGPAPGPDMGAPPPAPDTGTPPAPSTCKPTGLATLACGTPCVNCNTPVGSTGFCDTNGACDFRCDVGVKCNGACLGCCLPADCTAEPERQTGTCGQFNTCEYRCKPGLLTCPDHKPACRQLLRDFESDEYPHRFGLSALGVGVGIGISQALSTTRAHSGRRALELTLTSAQPVDGFHVTDDLCPRGGGHEELAGRVFSVWLAWAGDAPTDLRCRLIVRDFGSETILTETVTPRATWEQLKSTLGAGPIAGFGVHCDSPTTQNGRLYIDDFRID